MSRPSSSVFIVFNNADLDDTNLVKEIQAAIPSTVSSVRIPISHLHAYSTQTLLSISVSIPLWGVTVVVLSQSVIDDATYRAALVESVAGARVFSFRHYFICRDISIETVKLRPDLAPIFDNAAVVAESEIAEVIKDLNSYVSSHPFPSHWTLISPGLRLTFGQAMSVVLTAVVRLRVLLSLVATIGILLCAYAQPTWNASPALIGPLLCMCLFAAGLWLVRVHTLDLWPWLGPGWKLSTDVNKIYSRRLDIGYGPLTYWSIVIGILSYLLTRESAAIWIVIAGFGLQHFIDLLSMRSLRITFRSQQALQISLRAGGNTVDKSHLDAGIYSCLYRRRTNVWFTFGTFVTMLFLVCFATVRLHSFNPALYTIAFLSGLITPIAKSWCARLAFREVARFRGLTQNYLNWNASILVPRGPSDRPASLATEEIPLDHFTEDERLQVIQWLAVYRAPPGHVVRRWRTPKEYAFISYAWDDDSLTHMSTGLAKAFTAAGVSYFHDKKDIENKFSIWREHIAPALLSCTHFFLVVSPALKSGDVVLREIRATLQRWFLEALPAVICIAEPETARRLREDPTVSLALRFFLTACPTMSFKEAVDPRLLQYVMRHTRRQGMFQNWLTVLSAATALQRIVRMRGIVVSGD